MLAWRATSSKQPPGSFLSPCAGCTLLLSHCRGELASSDASVCWLPEHLLRCSCPCWPPSVLSTQGLGFSAHPAELYGLTSILLAFLFPFCTCFFSSLSVWVSLLASHLKGALWFGWTGIVFYQNRKTQFDCSVLQYWVWRWTCLGCSTHKQLPLLWIFLRLLKGSGTRY